MDLISKSSLEKNDWTFWFLLLSNDPWTQDDLCPLGFAFVVSFHFSQWNEK